MSVTLTHSAYVGPALLEIVDPNQFGAIPKSSCADAQSSDRQHVGKYSINF